MVPARRARRSRRTGGSLHACAEAPTAAATGRVAATTSCDTFLPMHRVAGLVTAEVVAFDLAIPAQVFGREPDLYAWTVGAPGGPCAVPTETGFDVLVPAGLEALEHADTVIVPGIGDHAWPVSAQALDALRAAAARGARVASICTGAFVLAAAGLLDGRRATTHWQYAERLQRAFPAVDVDPGVLFVD